MAKNKVEFGISNLYVGTYSVATDGTVTMGTPYHQAGAVSFAPEEQSESNKFYADNGVYWAGYTGGSFEGDLEVAKFDDDFKTSFLGYITKADGGIGIVKNATKPSVWIAFQLEGDNESRRATRLSRISPIAYALRRQRCANGDVQVCLHSHFCRR